MFKQRPQLWKPHKQAWEEEEEDQEQEVGLGEESVRIIPTYVEDIYNVYAGRIYGRRGPENSLLYMTYFKTDIWWPRLYGGKCPWTNIRHISVFHCVIFPVCTGRSNLPLKFKQVFISYHNVQEKRNKSKKKLSLYHFLFKSYRQLKIVDIPSKKGVSSVFWKYLILDYTKFMKYHQRCL